MRWGFLLALGLLTGCSSFGIRTSTQIPTFNVDAGTVNIHLHINGSIPGAGVESNVPIDKITTAVRTSLGVQEEAEETPSQEQERNPSP